ncbi:MAG: DinB family protein [Thermomicrobiales bacterium]
MSASENRIEKLLQRLDAAWTAFQASYAGLPDAQLLEPGVVADWSVRDIIAHVTIWEEEALKHLAVIIAGGRPPRYVTYGGIDAFNAQMIAQKRGLSLAEVRRQQDDTHRRLIDFIRSAPAEQFVRETRARRRLRLDTHGHYPLHTAAIQAWRARRSVG